MQTSIGLIVAVLALAVAGGAAYYVQTHGATGTTTSQPATQPATTHVPVTSTGQTSQATSTHSGEPQQPTTTAGTTTQTTMETGTASTTNTGATTTTQTTSTSQGGTPTTTTSTATTSATGTTTSTTHPATTTTTTVTTTTTTTATSTTTTTTTKPEATTTTTTTVTTSTSHGSERIQPHVFNNYKEFFGNFTHAKIVYKYQGGQEWKATNITVTLTATSNGFRVEIIGSTSGSNESPETSKMTIYLDKTMNTVTKIILPNGNVLTGMQAEVMGQQMLKFITYYVTMITWVGDMEVDVGTYTTPMHGWEIIKVVKGSATISGQQYRAYHVILVNKADTSSDTKKVELDFAEIRPSMWVSYRVHAEQKDGSVFDWELVELTPAQQ